MNVNEINNVGMMPYWFIVHLMNGKESRKVCDNTEIFRNDDNSVSVWFHTTEIIRAYCSGRTIIRNGGWQSVTTKQRLNAFLPKSVYISQSNFDWWVYTRPHNIRIAEYKNGMGLTFDKFGTLTEWGPKSQFNLSSYSAPLVNSIALQFVLSTDRPASELNDWLKDDCEYGHLANANLAIAMTQYAEQMIAAGMRKVAA